MHSKDLALPRTSHSGEIALPGSRRLRSTLAAAPVLFAHAIVTVVENCASANPKKSRRNITTPTVGYQSFGPIENNIMVFVTSACARRTGAASQAFERMHNTLRHRSKT